MLRLRAAASCMPRHECRRRRFRALSDSKKITPSVRFVNRSHIVEDGILQKCWASYWGCRAPMNGYCEEFLKSSDPEFSENLPIYKESG
jgi:hypothetical protein